MSFRFRKMYFLLIRTSPLNKGRRAGHTPLIIINFALIKYW
nr:MAG TPA: hypothetical protein [Caudoviricetes sp.]